MSTQQPQYPVVHVKCRRGSDKATEGQSCQSLSAENLTQSGSTVSQFRCTKCKHVWGVAVGGQFVL